MFDSVLIANRGEIAARVIRTCRRLGIRTIAVYSDVDRDSLHVALADEAHPIGGAPAADSYLNVDAVIAAAKASGAAAIHPGYGFLSENAEFARACADSGIVFIGPPVEAIAAMGSKSAAKARMEAAGVPILPGYHGDDQSDKVLADSAKAIGFPVLIKPSAGGGGRGMRLVEDAKDIGEAIKAARREAASSFGDDHLLVERYLARPRHVEVQVFGDSHGNVIHLYERDCSVQRRHQKIVEEAPAPGVSSKLRAAMGKAAVAAAQAISYVGAGTVEFLLGDDKSFYFMEMNTRLQVEHPVTEMVTGLDLVEWQLQVAAGEKLPLAQSDVPLDGHAFEVRLYAEDPAGGFVPSAGRISHLRLPEPSDTVRIDSGVREGDTVSSYYDPMMAKLIVAGPDRAAALARLRTALAGVEIAGLKTNTAFLAALADNEEFAAARVHTGLVEAEGAALVADDRPASARHLACAALAVIDRQATDAEGRAGATADPRSPWSGLSSWRLNAESRREILFADGARDITVQARRGGGDWTLTVDGEDLAANAGLDGVRLHGMLGGRGIDASVVRDGFALDVFCDGTHRRLVLHDPIAEADIGEDGAGSFAAPMPGVVVDVPVAAGAAVCRGDSLIVLEAMKVEHTIRAPADGTVEEIFYAKGDRVEEGVQLVAFTPVGAPAG